MNVVGKLRPHATTLTWSFLLVLLAVITWEFAASLQKWANRTVFNADAVAVYLPYAKRLINEGWPFLMTETAAHVPPVSYLLPALFGADLATQKQVGIALSVLVIPLLFRAGWVLHSRTAGLAAASLYAGSRLFKMFLPTAGVEPVFIFLTAVWIWGLAEGWGHTQTQAPTHTHAQRRTWPIIVAGAAFGLAALTRATVIYYLPMVLAVSWWLMYRASADRQRWRAVFLAHMLALAMVLPVLIKNFLLFGMPSVSTGAGIALFFGSSPLTWGLDQNYYTVALDINAIIPPGAMHLDVVSDRRLLAVAKHMLLTMDPWLIAKMFFYKLHDFLFLSEREWFGVVSEFRNYRILLFAFCWPLLSRVRSLPVVAIVGSLLVYQVVVHVPVLYSMRYSVVAIDLGLCFLAALGFAELVTRRRWLSLIATAAIVIAFAWAMQPDENHPPYPTLNLDSVKSRTVVSWAPDQFRIAPTANAAQLSPGVFEVDASGMANIDFDFTGVAALLRLTSHVATFEATVLSPTPTRSHAQACNPRVIYFYRKLREIDFQLQQAVIGHWYRDNLKHRYYVGGHQNLQLYEPGTFRVQLTCAPGTRIRFDSFTIVEPDTGTGYRDSYFKSKGWSGWPVGF